MDSVGAEQAGVPTRRIDALDLIRSAVREVATTWPAPDAMVKARTGNGGVLVWFEDASGRQVLPASQVAYPR